MFYARNLVTETFQSMHVYLLAAAIYLAMTIPMSRLVAYLERTRRAWQRGKSHAATDRGL